MAIKDRFSGWLAGATVTMAIGGLMTAAASPAFAATSLRKAAQSAKPAAPELSQNPGAVLYGYFDFAEPTQDNGTGNGMNVMRLINTTSQDLCALIYVFDDDEELGECCGCPLSANELKSFGIGSFRVMGPDPRRVIGIIDNLTANWREASGDPENGVVAVVAATAEAPCSNNGSSSNNSTPNPACNSGCDPTIHFQAGTLVQSSPSGQGLNGNIVHNQAIGGVKGLLEVSMFDDSPGDSVNTSSNLQDLCRNAVQNGSGRGWCTCPKEFADGPEL